MHHFVSIAIDGPVASGKSSVGLKLAESLRYVFLDTGIMYRAVTLAALQQEVDIFNEEAVTRLAHEINIEILKPSVNDGRVNDVLLNGEDITWLIKESQVNDNVSQVSTYAGVRSAMTEKQQRIAEQGSIVMVGRDIGTVVLPHADYKFFLNASVEERARRRLIEEVARGKELTLEEITENVRSRDEIDSSRAVAPLVPAEDAIVIETDHKSLEQVVEEINSYIQT